MPVTITVAKDLLHDEWESNYKWEDVPIEKVSMMVSQQLTHQHCIHQPHAYLLFSLYNKYFNSFNSFNTVPVSGDAIDE